MKLTVCLSASLFALLAMPAGSRAAAPNDPVNPYAGLDPDGVPLAITQGPDRKTSLAEQAQASQTQQEQDSRARNWLLLDYERQFRGNAQTATLDRTINMYLQLGMNRDLSAVANDSSVTQTATPAPSLHATPKNGSTQNSMSLRADGSPGRYNFAPLISPYNSSIASAASQPFGSGSFSTKLPSSLAPGSIDTPQAPAPAPTPHRSLTELPPTTADTVDMQTPGMIADKANPLPGMPNLNLDSLPDPSTTSAQNSQEPPELPELRQPVDAGMLHQEMSAKLAPPSAPQAQKPAVQPPIAPPAPPPPEEPMPINKQQQLSPVHAPVPSPFDMLNR